MSVQYQTGVSWDATLKDLEYTDSSTIGAAFAGLVISAVKVTAGAPSATAGKFIPGAIIQNAVSGVLYSNTGTTASPVWSVIDTASGGLPALTDGSIWVGNVSDVATAVVLSGDVTMDNTGAVTVTGAAGAFEAGGAITNAGGTLAVGFIPTLQFATLSGPGAIGITTYQTQFTSTGTGDALTLADASRIGHLKKISYVAEGAGGDTGVLTPTNLAGGTTLTFNAVGDYAVLMWNGTEWLVIDTVGATLA